MQLLMLPRYDALGASSRVRMLQYVPALEAGGVETTVSPLLDDEYVRALYAGRNSIKSIFAGYIRRLARVLASRKFDVIWLEKEVFPWLPSLLDVGLFPARSKLVVDYDDAVFHRYGEHEKAGIRRFLGGKIETVMRRADLVTAGNGYLAERAKSSGAKWIEYLPTAIDLNRYASVPKRETTQEVTVGWIGSPATAEYLHMVTSALETLRLRHAIRCIAIGPREDQVEGTPFEAWRWQESNEVELLRQFDIGIMPLPNAAWERGKCGYKLIQYMACSMPVVASPVGANREIVVHGENGQLASTTAEWISGLEKLVIDADLRRRMGDMGRRRVESGYSIQMQAPRLLEMLKKVGGKNRASVCAV
jgi:glycosyltransferase involved in cell wall biosynthesis